MKTFVAVLLLVALSYQVIPFTLFYLSFYLLNSVSYSSSIKTFFVGGNTSRKETVHRKQEHFGGHDIYIQ